MSHPNTPRSNSARLEELIDRGAQLAQERRSRQLTDEELDSTCGGLATISAVKKDKLTGGTAGHFPTNPSDAGIRGIV
jgi:hypothetical protein